MSGTTVNATATQSPARNIFPCTDYPYAAARSPPGQVWVHCGSGYRAGIAASMLDDDTRQIVNIDDAFTAAETLGLARPRQSHPE